VADRAGNEVSFDRLANRAIVSLKVARRSLDVARERLGLAAPLCAAGDDPRSLWLGPDRWLLVSDSMPADAVIAACDEALTGVLHNAVDYSAGLAVLRLAGGGARQLLATGTGIDLRPAEFAEGACCRTRLARIAAVITVDASGRFEIYADRSYESYLTSWLAESSSVCFSYLRPDIEAILSHIPVGQLP
jgi:heterotetrameric sarcosine oxidase gamma subunit